MVAVQVRRRDPLTAMVDEYGDKRVLAVRGDMQDPDSALDLVTQTSVTSVTWAASS